MTGGNSSINQSINPQTSLFSTLCCEEVTLKFVAVSSSSFLAKRGSISTSRRPGRSEEIGAREPGEHLVEPEGPKQVGRRAKHRGLGPGDEESVDDRVRRRGREPSVHAARPRDAEGRAHGDEDRLCRLAAVPWKRGASH
mmetsp:Transcript_26055/g.104263  ORF Transcript_26055/g.104263 Transcript_26055/m.104263 type:complete len:140 (+) Transcript_26055:743-1162(+)